MNRLFFAEITFQWHDIFVGLTERRIDCITLMLQGISNISNLFPDIVGPMAREVEDEANSYFQVRSVSKFNEIR